MSDPFANDSERLDAALATVVAARPGQPGSPLPIFAATVRLMAQRDIPTRERTALAWRWRHQLGPSAEKARSN
jgi:hypothetical protein